MRLLCHQSDDGDAMGGWWPKIDRLRNFDVSSTSSGPYIRTMLLGIIIRSMRLIYLCVRLNTFHIPSSRNSIGRSRVPYSGSKRWKGNIQLETHPSAFNCFGLSGQVILVSLSFGNYIYWNSQG